MPLLSASILSLGIGTGRHQLDIGGASEILGEINLLTALVISDGVAVKFCGASLERVNTIAAGERIGANTA